MEGGRSKEEEGGGWRKEAWVGAGGRHGQGYAGASARGDGIDGHISHSSVSRQDHRTWLRGGSAWSAVADFADICRWGEKSSDKDCPRHEILSGCWVGWPRLLVIWATATKHLHAMFYLRFDKMRNNFSIYFSPHLSQKRGKASSFSGTLTCTWKNCFLFYCFAQYWLEFSQSGFISFRFYSLSVLKSAKLRIIDTITVKCHFDHGVNYFRRNWQVFFRVRHSKKIC